jgi:hypothetical protein
MEYPRDWSNYVIFNGDTWCRMLLKFGFSRARRPESIIVLKRFQMSKKRDNSSSDAAAGCVELSERRQG